MATLLADSPPAPGAGQAPPAGSSGAPVEPPAASSPAPIAGHKCAKCAAELVPGQDWCLSCGAGAPGSLGSPSWHSAATVIGVVVVLVLGAAAAAVAALSKGTATAPVVTKTVAQVPPPASSAPVTPGTTPTTPVAPTPKSALPGVTKPPKIPLTAATPKASENTTTTPTTTTPSTETKTSNAPTSTTPSGGSGTGGEEAQQSAILLDTNAASTYNPYGYPASGFGDPSLAIDGDHATAWSAQLNPTTAPKMAQGLLIDLKAKQKVAVLELVSSTPGMTVQVYGAKGHTAPPSITDPAWVPLSAPTVAKKKKLRLALRDAGKQFTFITLWISSAPQASVGTATAPGHVDVNELELFPPKA